MRGSLKQRSPGSWSLILEFGYVRDPARGKSKRLQKWITFRGTRKAAERRLNDLIHDQQHGTFIEPDKRTVGEWLDEWVGLAIKPPRCAPRSYATYQQVIANHLKPEIGSMPLQGLRAIDVEHCLSAKAALSLAMREKIYNVLHSALEAAVKSQLVARNVAKLITGKPRAADDSKAAENCWTADDASTFLGVAKQAGPQAAAFYTLALDSGMRKSELAGLQWTDVDLPQGRLMVRQQLLSGGAEPAFSPTKGKAARAIDLGPETVELLKAHKAHQAAIKMRYRLDYHDFGLVFAKEWDDAGRQNDVLGHPLQVNNLGQREFAKLIASAKVKPITLHGLRHTCATLLLLAGVAPQVVQQRLGHKKIEITLGIYAHVLPGQQREAARRLSALLHGRG
jgi:integrase